MGNQQLFLTRRSLTPPVLLLVFNRPDTTRRVFEAVRNAKPSKLFVAADGPRENKPEDAARCAEVRAIVNDGIDWPCEVFHLYRDNNLGCKLAPYSAIDWFFKNIEEGIILEDDCLPHPTFFRFCQELLQKYRDHKSVMMVSGLNRLSKWKSSIQSYHFSNASGTWGWASWRRAWRYYDIDMKLWAEPEVKDRIKDVIGDTEQYNWRKEAFDAVFSGRIDTAWDYQWLFACLLYSGLSIVPSVNLVSNIGFREGATHTKDSACTLGNLPLYPMSFPLKEPQGVTPDREYDRLSFLTETGRLKKRKTTRVQFVYSKVKQFLRGKARAPKPL